MSKISIIVPVYFNESNLPTTIPTLLETVGTLPDMESELIFVDDGSKDRSYEILKEWSTKDPRIKVLKLARNFGAHQALLAGLDVATGDCMTFIMADLQDPPELILQMLTHWRAGSKIVIAERQDREDRLVDKLFAQSFWSFMRRYGMKNIPHGGFDFLLFDRAVAQVICRMRERNSHLMIQILWTGFSTTTIPYTRKLRKAGKSKWTFAKKLKLFIDSAIAFTFIPIRFMTGTGFFTALLGFAYAVYILLRWLVMSTSVQGWSSIMVALLVIGGLQMMLLGMIGEYLWRIFDATRSRPLYLVDHTLNLASSSAPQTPTDRPADGGRNI